MLLPAPFSPTSAWTSPRRDREIDAVERERRAEALADAGGAEQDRARASPHVGGKLGREQLLHFRRRSCSRASPSSTPVSIRFSTGSFFGCARIAECTPRWPIFQGFCTTSPWIWPFFERRHELLAAVESDELDLARETGALQREQHAERRGLVRAEDAVDARPWRIASAGSRRPSATSPTSARRTDRSRSISIPGNFAFMASRKPFSRFVVLAWPSWWRSMIDAALAAEQRAEPLGAERAAFHVVGRDEADVVGVIEVRVDDDDRDPGLARFLDDVAERPVRSSGASTMPLHAPRDEVLDDLDLLRELVLLRRSLPQDVDADSFAAASAPAWIDFQNSCVVPFGITAMTTRSCFALQATRIEVRGPRNTINGCAWTTWSPILVVDEPKAQCKLDYARGTASGACLLGGMDLAADSAALEEGDLRWRDRFRSFLHSRSWRAFLEDAVVVAAAATAAITASSRSRRSSYSVNEDGTVIDVIR